MRATACIVAYAPPPAPVSFLRHSLRNSHPQLLLGGRRELLSATHETETATQLPKSSNFYSVFRVDGLVLVALGRSTWWKFGLDIARSLFQELTPEYVVPWSVAVGAAVAPVATRSGSLFIGSVVVADNTRTATDCFGDVDPVGTCYAGWMNLSTSNRFESI